MIEGLPWFVALAFIAEIIGTVSGFGSSILFVPIAALFFDFKAVLGITAVFHIFSNLFKIALFKKGIDKNIVLKLGIPAIISVVIGAGLTTLFKSTEIALFMNIVVLALAIFLMVNINKTIKPSNSNMLIGGITSGFIAGIAGTGGAIRGITLASFNLNKDVFIATSALIDLGIDTSRAIVYSANGYFNAQYFYLIPYLVAVSFAGSYVGKEILKHTSEKVFRYIVLVVIFATAAFQIVQYFNSK